MLSILPAPFSFCFHSRSHFLPLPFSFPDILSVYGTWTYRNPLTLSLITCPFSFLTFFLIKGTSGRSVGKKRNASREEAIGDKENRKSVKLCDVNLLIVLKCKLFIRHLINLRRPTGGVFSPSLSPFTSLHDLQEHWKHGGWSGQAIRWCSLGDTQVM